MALSARQQLRIAAMARAADLSHADQWYAWLVRPEAVSLGATVTITDAHGTVILTAHPGGTMSTAMTVDQTATIVVLPEDDHGDATPDQLAWAQDDGGTPGAAPVAGTIASVTISADTHTATVVPVNPGGEGTVTVTASDPSSPALTPASVQLVVGPGETSQLVTTVTVS
jgi:hypothetical protein